MGCPVVFPGGPGAYGLSLVGRDSKTRCCRSHSSFMKTVMSIYLNSLAPGNVVVILNWKFGGLISRTDILPSGEWYKTSLTISQHWFRQWLGAVLWCHMATLGHSELIVIALNFFGTSTHVFRFSYILLNLVLHHSWKLLQNHQNFWPESCYVVI